MRRLHPGTLLPPGLVPKTESVSHTSNVTAPATGPPQLMNHRSSTALISRRRKRTAENNLAFQESCEDGEGLSPKHVPKHVKLGEREDSSGSQMTSGELVKENEMLRNQLESSMKEVERYHKMNQRLLVVIEQMTQKAI
jgi:hypothetical protein